MKKLELHFDNQLQGEFELKKLNLLLVFQVNCPGCFSYALPFYNKLYNEFNSEISFLALSTVFEDFDKNTLENTKELIERGTLVGETKKFMKDQGFDKLPYSLDFPIAMDKISIDSPEDIEKVINGFSETNFNFHQLSKAERINVRNRIVDYIKSLDKVALTFTLNQLRGTPSFVLFNSEYEILNDWFGHVSYDEIANELKQFV